MTFLHAQHVFDRHVAVAQKHLRRLRTLVADLVEVLPDGEARRPLLDHQNRHAPMARLRSRIRLDQDRQRVGMPGVRDPRLGAVDDVVVAVPPRDCRDALEVAARLRLGERDAGTPLAGGEIREPSRTLIYSSELPQQHRGERMRAEDSGHAHPRFRNLLEDDRIGDRVDGDAAVLLGHEHPEQAHRLHLVDDLFWVAAGQLPLARNRADALAREVAHQVAERGLLFGELEVHRSSPSALSRSDLDRAGRSSRCA